MPIPRSLFLFLIALLHPVANAQTPLQQQPHIYRADFPSDFIFGTASSAYQYEGASNITYKEKSIWDTFIEEFPDKIVDHSNASTADDFYHHFKSDVKLMKDLGFEAFRYSISWSRLMKYNKAIGKLTVNPDGLEFYQSLTNIIVKEGLKPFVTLFHWDTPQVLEDKYGGFLDRKIVRDYVEYAETCFREFGDRVKHWITFNEPHNFCHFGYSTGQFAPGRCTLPPYHQNVRSCNPGDSTTEPYKVAHNILLAHATAFRLYTKKYKDSQKGKIGMSLNTDWVIPYNPSNPADVKATQRVLDFYYGWFMDPMTHGNYPVEMLERMGEKLRKFTLKESEMLKGSYDFLGLNYYTSSYVMDTPCPNGPMNFSDLTDACAIITKERNNVPIGPKACSDWLLVYPPGIRDLMNYIKYKYNNPVVFITENGYGDCNTGTIEPDADKISYHRDHLMQLMNFINDTPESNVKGYFVWSFLDDFEWLGGYSNRYGLIFVNYSDPNLGRTPKDSAEWFKGFLKPRFMSRVYGYNKC